MDGWMWVALAVGAWWVWNNFLSDTQKDFITGGNAKVAANDMAALFRKCGGSYEKTVSVKCMTLLQMSHTANNIEALSLTIHTQAFDNLTELVVTELNGFAAPAGTALEHTYQDFHAKVAGYLRAHNIPEQYITGTNGSG